MKRYRPLAILSALAWGSLIGAALGDTIQATYTGAGSDNNWHNSANWQPATVPNGAGFCVTIPSSSGRIDFNNHAGFEELSIGAESEVRILQSWGLFTNVIENNGLITFDSVGLPRLQTSFDGSTTVNGSGTIRMAKTDFRPVLWGQNGTNGFTNGPNHTIEGFGYFEESLESLTNSGLISANVNGKTLQGITVDILLDGGELRAENGGILMIGSGSDITGLNGGFLRVGDGSRIDLSNLTLSSTEIKVTNVDSDLINNRVTVGSNIFTNDVTNTARIDVLDDSNSKFLFISDAFVNHGEIVATGGSTGRTGVVANGTATLSGQGRVVLNSTNRHFVSGTNASDTLTNGPGHTIEGQGNVGGGLAAIENLFNRGIIHSNLGGDLRIDAGHGVNTFVNESSGVLRVSNSGTMTIPGFGTAGLNWTSRGSIDVGPGCTFDAAGNATLGNILPTVLTKEFGNLHVDGDFDADIVSVGSAIISGSGVIRAGHADFGLGARVRPGSNQGSSIGLLTFGDSMPADGACGDDFQFDQSVVEIGIESPGSHDAIQFLGREASGSGTIQLHLYFNGDANNFAANDELEIISNISDCGSLFVSNVGADGRITTIDGRASFKVVEETVGSVGTGFRTNILLTEPLFGPSIPGETYEFEVNRDSPVGTILGTISVPVTLTGTPNFTLTEGTPFQIDPSTGAISVAQALATLHSLRNTYELRATVGGSNAHQGSTVLISVFRTNNEVAQEFMTKPGGPFEGITDPAIIDPCADPDGDGVCNVFEIWTGTNPAQPSPEMDIGTGRIKITNQTFHELFINVVPSVDDRLNFSGMFSNTMTGGFTKGTRGVPVPVPAPTPAQAPKRTVTYRSTAPVDIRGFGFLQYDTGFKLGAAR